MQSHISQINQFNLRNVHAHLWSVNRSMTVIFYAMLLGSVLTIIGFFVDPRATAITGAPIWAKSAKFSISTAVYAVTALWIFGYDTLRPKLSRRILTVGAWLLAVEMVFMYMQAIRGVPSHFNVTTAFNIAVFASMGTAITLFWFLNLLGVGVLMAQKLPSQAFAWSLRLGLIVAMLGMLEGYLMTSPSAEQIAAMQNGIPELSGSHTVGAPDGGLGLPFLGWSTTHGDLRIGHFVGLHGLQIIPLFGLFIMHRRESWLTERHRLLLVWIGAVGYLGFGLLVTWQALRQQPLLSPDSLTLGALSALIITLMAAFTAVIVHARVGCKLHAVEAAP